MLNSGKIVAKGLLHASEVLRQLRAFWDGYTTWRYRNPWATSGERLDAPDQSNPLRLFFDAHTEGPGIWKWRHYFDIYDRHRGRFRNRTVRVLEIGSTAAVVLRCGGITSGLAARFMASISSQPVKHMRATPSECLLAIKAPQFLEAVQTRSSVC
jgi:hypothetical protein